eukprot:COSAG02_NODE_44414_length_366_cov_1.074906_1_plen_21_part_10
MLSRATHSVSNMHEKRVTLAV